MTGIQSADAEKVVIAYHSVLALQQALLAQ